MRPSAHRNVLPSAHDTRPPHTIDSNLNFASTSSSGLDSIRCPITYELFVHPVLAEDGYTYEQSAIERWIEEHGTSPMTRDPMTIAGLRPNRAIRDAVQEFRTTNGGSNRRLPIRSIPISFKYELNVDVQKTTALPFAQTFGKSLFHAEWIQRQNRHERLVLLYITGDRAMKEAQLNVQMPRHPHIVRTLGLVKHDGEGMLLLQEYAERGNLSDLLHTERYLPTPPVIHHIILQIVDALIFLTEQGIVHGDLACRNVLVFKYDPIHPSHNLVKLTDFGISRRSSAVTSYDVVAILSSAPEVLHSRAYSEKSDVWAFAVLAWEIFSKGSTPMVYQGNRDFNENDRRILAGERLIRPPTCPPVQWAIFLECMQQDSNRRPTFVQLKEKLLRS
jgi:tRNA A-37 threonylcarbamoyl transferase component Bud32